MLFRETLCFRGIHKYRGAYNRTCKVYRQKLCSFYSLNKFMSLQVCSHKGQEYYYENKQQGALYRLTFKNRASYI